MITITAVKETPTETRTATNSKLKGKFADFKGMFCNYAVNHGSAYYKDMAIQICNLNEMETFLFISYISVYWDAYTMDIINGDYKYINLTEMVWNAWLEYLEC